MFSACVLAALQIGLWQLAGPAIWHWQTGGDTAVVTAALGLWPAVAGVFALGGCNIVLIAEDTGVGRVRRALMLALARALILPLALLGLFEAWRGAAAALWALPLAELCVLSLAIVLRLRGIESGNPCAHRTIAPLAN